MIDITSIQISNEQAKQFAKAIYTDVIEYIKNHKDENEYENYSKQEEIN